MRVNVWRELEKEAKGIDLFIGSFLVRNVDLHNVWWVIQRTVFYCSSQ